MRKVIYTNTNSIGGFRPPIDDKQPQLLVTKHSTQSTRDVQFGEVTDKNTRGKTFGSISKTHLTRTKLPNLAPSFNLSRSNPKFDNTKSAICRKHRTTVRSRVDTCRTKNFYEAET
ncbi:uncharacterized protein [Physcomitrium patens]|uniref:uncharacterized protein n=1 Tax=Physcomitrium patens TaxID=3218 RepID=UPI003CCDA8A9